MITYLEAKDPLNPKMKPKIIPWIIEALLIISLVNAATLYVNNSNPSCDDNIDRATNDISNPWCGANTTMFYQAESGDEVIFNPGTYRETNGAGWVVSNKDYGPAGVIFTFPEDTILTASYTDYIASNSWWTQEANNTDGSIVWNATRISTSSTYMGCFYEPDQINFIYSPAEANLTQNNPYFPNYTSWWSTTGNDRIKIKMPSGVNPNNGGIYCGKAPTLTFTNVDNIEINGGKWISMQYMISTTSGVDNLTIRGANITGGINDNGVIRIESATGINIIDNTIAKADGEQYGLFWNLVKQGTTNTETSAIKLQDCDNCNVENNNISGYFNGIVLVGSSPGDSSDSTIISNTIDWIMDDSIEIEDYIDNTLITENWIGLNTYVCLSGSPANSSTTFSNFSYNTCLTNRTEATYNNTGSYTDGTNQKLYNELGFSGWYRHNNNFLNQNGLSCNSQYSNQQNVSDYNNIYFGDSVNILDCTGLELEGNSYNYNLYFTDSGYLARYVNSTTDSTTYTTIADLKNAMLTWNTYSIEANPEFGDSTSFNFTPIYNSSVCGAGMFGGDIGAYICTSAPTPTPTPTTCSNTEIVLYGLMTITLLFGLVLFIFETGLISIGTILTTLAIIIVAINVLIPIIQGAC